MKTKPTVLCLFLAAFCVSASGQGTAFTYQGRLNDGVNPASGIYDLRFTIYGGNSGGSAVAGPLTNATTSVSNGIFTVTLDFGSGVFTGLDRWLEIDVRTNGVGGFITLSPRQALTATPYATYAKGANAAGLTGALPSTILNGIYSNPLTLNNGANSFSGSFYGQFFGTSFTGGSFAGDGSGLINLNASQIAEGTFPASSLGNAWRIIGNSGTGETNFIGTTDNQALDFRVANIRGFRIEPDPRPGSTSANLIGGNPSNRVDQPGSGGSAIVGGGLPSAPNIVRSNSSGVFIGAGSANEAGPNANDVVVAGGFANIARTYAATIGGGGYNLIETNADYSTIAGGGGNTLQPGSGFSVIAGGYANAIQTNSGYSTLVGGYQNEIQGNAGQSAIGGGLFNKIQVTADQSAIAGGNANQIFPGARESFIGGGFANQIRSNAYNSVIGGGSYNVITNAGVASIGGGTGNTNNGFAATVAGGFFNTAIGNGATVGGGGLNVAAGFNATVVGGDANQSLAPNAFVGGGFHNTNSGNTATIAGGFENTAAAPYATVPGGYQNRAAGGYSFAAGRQAKANHQGAFIWGDSTAADFPSAVNNEFAVRAGGGVRFVSPGMTLNGQPVLTASSTNAITLTNVANTIVGTFTGDGTGLTNVNAWRLNGNAGTAAGVNFIGTTDSQPLELKVNNQRVLRLEPTASAPNIVGGYIGNIISSGVTGGVIAGGGESLNIQRVGGNYATVGGGLNNSALQLAATVAGGHSNTAAASYDTVSGGFQNTASGVVSTVGGGAFNIADGNSSVIGGGNNNRTGAGGAAVAGGGNNIGNGFYSMIPGGRSNETYGAFSFVGGYRAKTIYDGSFVWADSTEADMAATGQNQFLIRASGGVGINTNNPLGAALSVNGNITTSGGLSFADPADSITFPAVAGASGAMINMFADGTVNATRMVIAHSPTFQTYGLRYLDSTDQFEFIGAGSSIMSIGLGSGNVGIGTNNPISKLHVIGGATFSSGGAGANQTVSWSPGSASWSFTSDRNAKDRVQPVRPEVVLEKVTRIPIHEWSYIGHEQRHIGPMAQDFNAQFPLNDNDKALNQADLHGVTLAAIQGLNQKLVEELKRRDAENADLKTRLERLEKLLSHQASGGAW